jgi:hypothetical protein
MTIFGTWARLDQPPLMMSNIGGLDACAMEGSV